MVSQHAAAHPDATLTSNVSVDEVQTSPRILSVVLEELVANALEHAGQGPEVTVGVQRADGRDRSPARSQPASSMRNTFPRDSRSVKETVPPDRVTTSLTSHSPSPLP